MMSMSGRHHHCRGCCGRSNGCHCFRRYMIGGCSGTGCLERCHFGGESRLPIIMLRTLLVIRLSQNGKNRILVRSQSRWCQESCSCGRELVLGSVSLLLPLFVVGTCGIFERSNCTVKHLLSRCAAPHRRAGGTFHSPKGSHGGGQGFTKPRRSSSRSCCGTSSC